MSKISLMMVCRANICRSPMAEAMLRQRIKQLGLVKSIKVDSAGTRASQPGHKPDARAQRVLAGSGVSMAKIKARQITVKDLERSDIVVAMDASNVQDLLTICPLDQQPKIKLMTSYGLDPGKSDIPDPYFGTIAGFEEVFRLLDDALNTLLEETIESIS